MEVFRGDVSTFTFNDHIHFDFRIGWGLNGGSRANNATRAYRIYINFLDDHTVTLQLPRSTPISALRASLSEHYTNMSSLLFEYNGRTLEEDSTLGANNIGNGATVNVVFPPRTAIIFNVPDGSNITVTNVPRDAQVFTMLSYFEMLGYPSSSHRLVYAGRTLEGSSTWREHDIIDGTTVHVVPRLLGGVGSDDDSDELRAAEELGNRFPLANEFFRPGGGVLIGGSDDEDEEEDEGEAIADRIEEVEERAQWLEEEIRRSNAANADRFDRFLFINRHFDMSPPPNALPNALPNMEQAGPALSIATMQMFMQFEQTIASTRDLAEVHSRSIAGMEKRLREVERFRGSVMENLREMQQMHREMTASTIPTIEDFESRFSRFNERVITLERVCFDEPAATRRRTGEAPVPGILPMAGASVPEATVPGFLPMAVASGTGAAGALPESLQRSLDAMSAAVAEEVARRRHISLVGAINGDRIEQFFVKTVTGQTLTFYTNGIENTTSLINKIQAKFPLRAGEEIRLIYEGRQLTENYVNIRAGTTVHMLMRLRGGMRAASSSGPMVPTGNPFMGDMEIEADL